MGSLLSRFGFYGLLLAGAVYVTPVEAKPKGYCYPVGIAEFESSLRYSGARSEYIVELVTKGKKNVCENDSLLYQLNKAYTALNSVIKLKSPFDFNAVDQNQVDLERRLNFLTPKQISTQARQVVNYFSDNEAQQYFQNNPYFLLVLSVGPQPVKYIPLIERMLRPEDKSKLAVLSVLVGAARHPLILDQTSPNLRVLSSNGFEGLVKSSDLSDLLRTENIRRLSGVKEAQQLYSKYGVVKFDWFSTPFLERASATLTHPKNRKVVIYLVTRDNLLNTMLGSPELNDYHLSELKGYEPLLIQPADVDDLQRVFNQIYLSGISAEMFFISAHGLSDSIGLSSGKKMSIKDIPQISSSLDRILSPDASIIVASCSTAKGEHNFSRVLAETVHRPVYGAKDVADSGLFWYDSPDRVIIGRKCLSSCTQKRSSDLKLVVPSRAGLGSNKKRTFMGKIVDLTQRYYFPK